MEKLSSNSTFELLSERKVFKDPIHGNIRINYKVIWDVINTKEFQRLRRIKQLGGVYVVYHGAEHSRFSHSLGVYELARKSIEEIDGLDNLLNEYDKVVYMLAALLHDLGHGPFSHAFEEVSSVDHEELTCRIITEESEINAILNNANKNLAQDISDVISKNTDRYIIKNLISSQVDVDRLDYLCRDTYFTGTTYGEIDIDRMFRVMQVNEQSIYFKESGIHILEDYLLNRYQMYWQVYFHPVSRSYEILVNKIYKRIKYLVSIKHDFLMDISLFVKVLTNDFTIEDFYSLDDYYVVTMFNKLSHSSDPILSDLCQKHQNRGLFKYFRISSQFNSEKFSTLLKEAGIDPYYYTKYEMIEKHPYSLGSDTIKIMNNKKLAELSDVSDIVKSISRGTNKSDIKIFFDINKIREIEDEELKDKILKMVKYD